MPIISGGSGAAGTVTPAGGWVAETFQTSMMRDSLSLTSGTLTTTQVKLFQGQTVTNVWFYVSTAITTITLIRAGIFDSSGNLVASFANDATLGSTGMKTKALTTPLSIAATGNFWVGFLTVATTPGALLGLGAAGNALWTDPAGLHEAFTQAGLSDLPNPATVTTGTTNYTWFGLS